MLHTYLLASMIIIQFSIDLHDDDDTSNNNNIS
jgi:hypothetical protein